MRIKYLLAIALMVCSLSTKASIIFVDGPAAGTNDISLFDPSGQSFTALGKQLMIFGFFVVPLTTAQFDTTVTFELRVGDGTGGPLLRSTTVDIPGLFNGFVTTVDFNNIPLTPGARYTALIRNDTSQWGYERSDTDAYAGGSGYIAGAATGDIWFFATFVPEPGTLGLFCFGLAALAARHRRKERDFAAVAN